MLIGHGTFDGTAAKFNLVGPDMDSREWKASLDGNPARLVFVNTTSSSFQFVPALSGKNRIVIAATDSAAQKYATLFPQYFIEALDQGAKADNDKNGRLSVWEVFAYASQAVKQAFEKQGTLVTERSLIDDNGDGVGKEAAAATGTDGVLSKTTFLDPLPASSSGNAALAGPGEAPRHPRSRDRTAEGEERSRCRQASTKKNSSGSPSSSPRSPRRFEPPSNFAVSPPTTLRRRGYAQVVVDSTRRRRDAEARNEFCRAFGATSVPSGAPLCDIGDPARAICRAGCLRGEMLSADPID